MSIVIQADDYLKEWEDPAVVDGRSSDVVADARSLKTAVEGMEDDWRSIAATYEGEKKTELVDGMTGAQQRSEDVLTDAQKMDGILWEFVSTLRGLVSRRSALTARVDKHNAAAAQAEAAGGTTLANASAGAALLRTELEALQDEYERAVEECADALGRLVTGVTTVADWAMGMANTWNGAEGQLIHEALFGFPDNVARMRVGSGPDGIPVPGSQAWRVMFFNQDITGLLAAMKTLRTDFLTSMKTRAMLKAWATTAAGPLLVSVLGSPHLAPAVLAGGMKSMVTAAVAAARTDLKDAVKAAARGQVLPVAVQTALVKEGKLDRVVPVPGQTELTKAQGAAVKKAQGSYLDRFKTNFVDELPIIGEAKGELEARKATQVNGADLHETDGMKKFATGMRGANVAFTVAGAGLTFQGEQGRELAEVRREDPTLSAEDAQAEATKRSAAQTAGNVGSTALASAAAGAAVGSAIPVAGTIVGFGVGLAAGWVMSHQGLDDADGDGEQDSFAERAGDVVEAVVKKDPGKAVEVVKDTAEDVVNGAKDAAKGAVDTVAGWFGR